MEKNDLISLAKTYQDEGEKELISKNFIRAATLFDKAYNIIGEENSKLQNQLFDSSYRCIWILYSQKNYEQMEYFACISVHFARKLNDELKLAKSLNGVAIALYNLRKPSIEYNIEASRHFSNLLEKTNIKKDKMSILSSKIKNDLGIVLFYIKNNDFINAEKLLLDLLIISKDNNLSYEMIKCRKISALLEYSRKNVDKAIETLLEIKSNINLNEANNLKYEASEISLILTELFIELNEIEKASSELKNVSDIYDELKISSEYYFYLNGLISEQNNEIEKAIENYRKAADILTEKCWQIKLESNQASFLKDKEIIYFKLISNLLKSNQVIDAVYYSEQYRARLLKENLMIGNRIPLAHVPENMSFERNDIITELNKIEDAKQSPNDTDGKITLQKKLYDIEEKIAMYKRSYGFALSSSSFEIKKLQASIPDNKMIIEYFYYDDRLFILNITREKIEAFNYNIDSIQLEKLLEGFQSILYSTLSMKDANKIVDYYFKNLYDILIKPMISNLKSNLDEILIIPFKKLHSFPFQLLFVQNDITIPLSIMPNLQSLMIIKNSNINFDSGFFVADPNNNLKGSIEEVNAISSLFVHQETLVKEQANKSDIISKLALYSIFHYSGHAHFNNQYPLYSYLECTNKPSINNSNYLEKNSLSDSEDRILLKDIYELDLENLDFVFLSGCSSGLGNVYHGEEVIGMVRGFFFAGAKSVLATLWDVEDNYTKDFAIMFYNKLKEHDGNKKKALLETYIHFKGMGIHPYHYGGFQLYETI